MVGLVEKYILVLGDLLQLPPVFEGPVYPPMSADLTANLTGCVGTINLWRKLFTYDELTITMRQKDDADFSSRQFRVRVGFMTDEDVDQFEKRKISFSSDTVTGRLEEVAKLCKIYLVTLSAFYPLDTCVNNLIIAC